MDEEKKHKWKPAGFDEVMNTVYWCSECKKTWYNTGYYMGEESGGENNPPDGPCNKYDAPHHQN